MHTHAPVPAAPAAMQTSSAAPAPTTHIQRKCACGGTTGPTGECEACKRKRELGVQTKLAVNQPGDRFEQEADRIADHVMQMTDSPTPGPLPAPAVQHGIRDMPIGVQRQSLDPKDDEDLLQAKGSPVLTDAAAAAVQQMRQSGGQPLDQATRTRMERRFGHDFGDVRIHADSVAANAARSVQARAFTIGRHIAFGHGEFRPETRAGGILLAHELTHAVQQGAAPSKRVDGMHPHASTRAVRISRTSLSQVQRTPVGCANALRQNFRSNLSIGNAVEAAIVAHYTGRLGPPHRFNVESGSSAPYRDRPGTTIPPQVFNVPSVRSGVGVPDLAYKSSTGAAMLVAEIKPANFGGVILGEAQVANYIDKGNAPENAALRRALGVKVFSPMLGIGRFAAPASVNALGKRYKVLWCGPGLIVYYSGTRGKKKGKKKRPRGSRPKPSRPSRPTTPRGPARPPPAAAPRAARAAARRATWKQFWRLVVKKFGIRGAAAAGMAAADGPLPIGDIIGLGLTLWTIYDIIDMWDELWKEAENMPEEPPAPEPAPPPPPPPKPPPPPPPRMSEPPKPAPSVSIEDLAVNCEAIQMQLDDIDQRREVIEGRAEGPLSEEGLQEDIDEIGELAEEYRKLEAQFEEHCGKSNISDMPIS